MSGQTYIVSDKPRGVLYTGVTSHLLERVRQHREKLREGFTKQYGCRTLVWFETHDNIVSAIHREKRIKHWLRDWKIDLIEGLNPSWDDLFDRVYEIENPYRSRKPSLSGDPPVKPEDDGTSGSSPSISNHSSSFGLTGGSPARATGTPVQLLSASPPPPAPQGTR